MNKNYLFVCGTPRSGTTAMWKFLVNDPRIAMGVERYGNLFFKKPITTELFEFERFFEMRTGDTFYQDLYTFSPYYANVKPRFTDALYFGDKIPLLYRHLDAIFENIPNAKVIFLLRNIIDVAASYEARANNPNDKWKDKKRTAFAIKDWRDSLRTLSKYNGDERVFPIIYEDFFVENDHAVLNALYQFLAIPQENHTLHAYQTLLAKSSRLEQSRKRHLPLESVQLICETAPFLLYRQLITNIRRQYASIQ